MSTTVKPDYWSLLGLEPGSDLKQLKRAFRREARKWHPDLNGNDIEAEEISIKSLTIKTNSTYNNANKNTILHRKDNTEYAPYYNVFVKKSGKNLSEYIINLGKNKIKKKEFITLFDYLFKKLNKLRKIKKFSKLTLDNHNKDVNILHFKFMDRNL